jgi:hypothetical protein
VIDKIITLFHDPLTDSIFAKQFLQSPHINGVEALKDARGNLGIDAFKGEDEFNE